MYGDEPSHGAMEMLIAGALNFANDMFGVNDVRSWRIATLPPTWLLNPVFSASLLEVVPTFGGGTKIRDHNNDDFRQVRWDGEKWTAWHRRSILRRFKEVATPPSRTVFRSPTVPYTRFVGHYPKGFLDESQMREFYSICSWLDTRGYLDTSHYIRGLG